PQPSHPGRHDQPPRQRDRRGRVASRLPPDERPPVRAVRAGSGAGEPRRAHFRARRGAVAALPGSHGRCPGRPCRVVGAAVLRHGRSGHASMPGIADNALVKAARLVERIAAYRPEPQIQLEVEVFLRALLGEVPKPGDVVARARERDATVAELIEPLLAPTFAPTMISASRKRNVIPALCEIVVDCRLLPGQTPAEIEPVVRGILGTDIPYDLEFLKAEGGTRSSLETPLWSAVESFVAE